MLKQLQGLDSSVLVYGLVVELHLHPGMDCNASISCDSLKMGKPILLDLICCRFIAGQSVERVQMVRGIEFCYQPPPRSAVPYAAALKGQNGR